MNSDWGVADFPFVQQGVTAVTYPPFAGPENKIYIETLDGDWSTSLQLPNTLAVGSYSVGNSFMNYLGNSDIDSLPRQAQSGSVTVLEADDAGIAGNFDMIVQNGSEVSGTFAIPRSLSIAASLCPPPPPSPVLSNGSTPCEADAGCSGDLSCAQLSDGGTPSGVGVFNAPPTFSGGEGFLCRFTEQPEPVQLSIQLVDPSGQGALEPELVATYGDGGYSVEVLMSCCPSGPGTFPITASIVGPAPNCPQDPDFSYDLPGVMNVESTADGLAGVVIFDGPNPLDEGGVGATAQLEFSFDPTFVSTTDGGSTGVCPSTCVPSSFPACPAPTACVMACGQSFPDAITNDGTSLYWLTNFGTLKQNGAIMTMPLAGGTPQTLLGSLANPFSLVVQNGTLYWTSENAVNAGSQTKYILGGISTVGGQPSVLSEQLGTLDGLAATPDAILANYEVNNLIVNGGAIQEFVLDGGVDGGLAIASNTMYSTGIAVNSEMVFWTTLGVTDPITGVEDGGGVWQAGLVDGSPVELVRGVNMQGGLALDSNYVYWSDTGKGGQIGRVAFDGGAAEILVGGQINPGDVAVDATNVYWINEGSGTPGQVMEFNLTTGVTTILASGLPSPAHLTIDSQYVYWTNVEGTTVMRAPK